MSEIKWLHSSGPNNKNPDYDLGGIKSVFQIAESPMNNLFDNITPEELEGGGYEDFRCFYITNIQIDSVIEDANLEIKTQPSCTAINIGSKVENEIQEIIFHGRPVKDGFFIMAMEWGPELYIKWPGNWAAFATEIQNKIRTVKYHELVQVTLENSGVDWARYYVTFTGDMRHRKVCLMQLIKNNLAMQSIREYRIHNWLEPTISGTTYTCLTEWGPQDPSKPIAPWNQQGSNEILVEPVVSPHVPQEGILHIPYPYANPTYPITWGYMHLSYSGYSGHNISLVDAIPDMHFPPYNPEDPLDPWEEWPCWQLGQNDEVWIDLPNPMEVCLVSFRKVREGWPIRQIAYPIEKSTNAPDWDNQGSNFDVGTILPGESFFVWVQRTVTSAGCKDRLELTFSGTSKELFKGGFGHKGAV